MAIIENNYVGDGVTVLYPFTFEYIDAQDVKVQLDGTDTTEYSLDNATTVRMDSAPGIGVEIRVYRSTSTDSMPATFFAGSTIQASDLNDNFNVALFVSQEAQVGAEDAGQSLPVAIAAKAAADAAVVTANAAAADATEALTTANAADAIANTANTNANQALVDSSAALLAAGNALAEVELAQQSAQAAEDSAAAAEAAAANAQTSADAAVTSANTAVTTANAAQTTANNAQTTATNAQSTANTANSRAAAAETDAAQAVAVAQAAADAVGDALLFDSYPNLAALPAGTSGDAAEVVDSTGVESDSRITGVPAGFVGDPGLLVRLIKNGTWQFQSYTPNDPDNRYLNPTDAAAIDAGIAAAQATADAALPKSGGTMTGIINFAPAQDFGVQDASTTVKGIVQLSNSVSSTSQTLAATPRAVKDAYDAGVNANNAAGVALTAANNAQGTANQANTTANAALPRSGGTMTGEITFSANQNFPNSGLPTANATSAGVSKLSSSVTSNIGTDGGISATPAAVKAAYDRGSQGVASANAATTTANLALPKSGGTMTGTINFVSGQTFNVQTGNASTKGILQLSNRVDFSSGMSNGYAATPSAVKQAYDKAEDALAAASAIAVTTGTWNPSVSKLDNDNQDGYWYRIGDLVFINFRYSWDGKSSNGDDFEIDNLPFTAAESYNGVTFAASRGLPPESFDDGEDRFFKAIYMHIPEGSKKIELRLQDVSDSSPDRLQTNSCDDEGYIWGSGVYIAQ